jgi:hypothetical protein
VTPGGGVETTLFEKGRPTMATMPLNRRWVVAPMLTIIGALSLVAPVAARPTADTALSVAVGQGLFWDGHHVGSARVPYPALCGLAGPCWDYRVRLEAPGARLRVALGAILPSPGGVRPWPDFPVSDSQTMFRLQVFAPDADPATDAPVAEGSTGEALTAYAVEVFVRSPAAGTYTLRVIPQSVTDMAFRMRARLEPDTGLWDTGGAVPPNLRVVPPFEFSFQLPTVNYGPSGGAPLWHSRGCMADDVEEAVEEDLPVPQLCLRYSMGFENAGEGRLDLRFDLPGCAEASRATRSTACSLHQRIWASNGTWNDREPGSAGRAKLHAVHGHFHYQNVYEFHLLAVNDGWRPGGPPPRLQPVAPGRKLGAFPDNELLADWHRFHQAERDTIGDSAIQLEAGWGDIYEWNRSGNYIDFPQSPSGSRTPRDGFYVVRGVSDPLGLVVETDEADNTSYAFIEVRNDGHVKVLERGYGTDPWDPNKVVLTVSPA